MALITGGGRGIGQGIAEVLGEEGVLVAVNDLHPERAEATVEAVAAAGGDAVAVPFDVTDYEAVQENVARLEAEQRPLDILVNNAGIPEGRFTGPFVASGPADWDVFVRLNIYGAMHCVRTVLPGMIERGWGRVIQMSSGSAARGLPTEAGESIYGASKAYMDSLLRHVALEVAGDGVTFNAIAPGVMEAARAYADPAVIEAVLARVPIGRLGESREIGHAVAWLASEEGGFVTGQVIHLNGGAYQGR
ncbi:MAG: SDR family oxidoreductase [Actinobacteria bacterium]|nr:SDR family oxidoreductase [Actinomycetota bacterium]